ncbi:hypothetical protein GPA22_19160 [Aromatoleum toluvorans]|uniref:DUF4148 domain-containing protein n=1 Tax=Aromatoleum toluvorans TaxID=92002 RepID=A0ABX1Q4L1_9RHOO|nr:hypothetical protein [Aromatoleum toluvorans]NMG45840.1 hypothetical protein [Aromatoleum toluvorans]
MTRKSAALAVIGAVLILALPSTVAADAVSDESFDRQARALDEGAKLKEDAGVFGRPGLSGEEGPRASAVGDRELDRYVQRLALEIRLRNAISDRDPGGFH